MMLNGVNSNNNNTAENTITVNNNNSIKWVRIKLDAFIVC